MGIFKILDKYFFLFIFIYLCIMEQFIIWSYFRFNRDKIQFIRNILDSNYLALGYFRRKFF